MTYKEIEKILKKDGWFYYDTVGSLFNTNMPLNLVK